MIEETNKDISGSTSSSNQENQLIAILKRAGYLNVKLDNTRESAEMALISLQMVMDRFSKSAEVLSNLWKKVPQTETVNNPKYKVNMPGRIEICTLTL